MKVERAPGQLARAAWVRKRPRNQGVVQWLLACAEKDYFAAIESEPIPLSEPTEAGVRVVDPFQL